MRIVKHGAIAHNHRITSDLDYVPFALRRLPQWVAWHEVYERMHHDERFDRHVGVGKPKKKPYRLTPPIIAASTSDAGTWGTYQDARPLVARARAHPGATGGVGFVITEDDPFCCLDFDGAIDPDGVISPEVARIVEELGSYAELSPSGTGLHVWVMGTKPGNRTKATVCEGVTVEVFDANQFVTVTGKVVRPGPIRERQEALDALYERFFPEGESVADGDYEGHEGGFKGEDEDLLGRARSAKTGAEFSALHDDGDLSSVNGDHSRGDYKLCKTYAFYTGRDAERMDRLFRLSALYREKWDEVHGGDGATYGEMTIRAASSACKNVYRPGRATPGAGVLAAMDAVEEEVWERKRAGVQEFKGKAGNTNFCITLTLLRLGRERGELLPTGCVRVPVSFRELADEARVSLRAVTRYAGRIKATGLVRQDAAKKSGLAGAFVLVPPKSTTARTVHTVSTRGRGTLPVDNVDDSRAPDELIPLRYSASGVKRAGKGGELVVRLLQRNPTPLTAKQMEDATGTRARDLRSGVLHHLETWGVVIHEPRADTYRLSSDWKERYAAMREYGGELLQDEAQRASRAWDRSAYRLHDADILHARKPSQATHRRLEEAQSALTVATEAREEARKAYRDFLEDARSRPDEVSESPCTHQDAGVTNVEAVDIPPPHRSRWKGRCELTSLVLRKRTPRLPNHANARAIAHPVHELPIDLVAAIKRDDPATRSHPDDCGCLGCETLLPDPPRYARATGCGPPRECVFKDALPKKHYTPCAA